MRTLFLLAFSVGAALAQPFSFGLKAGVPITDFFSTVRTGRFEFNSINNRYILGPSAELKLPFGLGVEFDVLYRRMNYQGSGNLVDVFVNNRTTANAWEFPLLLKYRLGTRVVRPYVDAGVAWDSLSGIKSTVTQTFFPSRTVTNSTSNPAELNHNTIKGFVAGVGLDVHALFVHISPELRYTRWGSQHFSDVNGLLHSNQNQGEFLLGITF